MNLETINKAKEHLKSNDQVMAKLIDEFEFSLIINENHFEALVKTIIDQQLNLKVANLIYQKLKSLLKDKFDYSSLLEIDEASLRNVGLSYFKISYLKDLALKYKNRELDFNSFYKLDDQSVIKELTKIKGIGIWSAQIFLIFSLERANVLPVVDMGIKRAIRMNYGFDHIPSNQEVEKLALEHTWSPYQTIASIYLWKSLKNSP